MKSSSRRVTSVGRGRRICPISALPEWNTSVERRVFETEYELFEDSANESGSSEEIEKSDEMEKDEWSDEGNEEDEEGAEDEGDEEITGTEEDGDGKTDETDETVGSVD